MPEKIYLTLSGALLSALILIYGFVSSKNLAPEIKKLNVQKFALIAVIPSILGITLAFPAITSYSGARNLPELKSQNYNSAEDVARLERDQSRQIEVLKDEVQDLRKDLYELDKFNSLLLIALCSGATGAIAATVFAKSKQIAKISEDKQQNYE